MDNRDIDNLIIDYLLYEDNSTPVDPKLEQWIVQSEVNSLTFAQYKKIWERLPHAARKDRFDTVRAFEEVDKANRKRVSLQGRIKNWGYALSGVAVTLLLFLLTNQFVMVDEKPFSMTTDYGSRSEAVLPDGSNVKLNAGSRITYQYKKKENIREVIFEGEGFFEVSKNDNPFVVKTTGGIEVEVLGTTFNLTAYADEPDIQVSLIEGKVQFHTNNRKLVMKPGQIAIAHKSRNEIRLQEGVLSHSYGCKIRKTKNTVLSKRKRKVRSEKTQNETGRFYSTHTKIEQRLNTLKMVFKRCFLLQKHLKSHCCFDENAYLYIVIRKVISLKK